jgi:hypothetical protein
MNPRPLLAGTVACAVLFTAPAYAQDTSSRDQGFVPDTGQINPGSAPHPWSTAARQPAFANPTEVRAALTMRDPGTISLGEEPNASGKPQPETTGKGITSTEEPGPIGSTMQTKPAKFSHRNDVLDHTPIMGWPTVLDTQQRQQIVQAVRSQSMPAAAVTKDFKPADVVPYAFTAQVQPLPDSLRGAPDLRGIAYMRSKDKVYLVTTTTADPIVVDVLDGK